VKFFFAAIALAGCHVTIPTPAGPSDESVYESLLKAGCLAETEAGPSDVAAEHELYEADAGQNSLLVKSIGCLYAGGTVVSCAVPCTPE
jgi:hypothetical protein